MFPSLCVCVAPPRPHFREDDGMCKINRQQMPRSRPAGPSERTCRPCAASLSVLKTGAKMRTRCVLSRDFSTSARAVDVRRPSGPRTSRSATRLRHRPASACRAPPHVEAERLGHAGGSRCPRTRRTSAGQSPPLLLRVKTQSRGH